MTREISEYIGTLVYDHIWGVGIVIRKVAHDKYWVEWLEHRREALPRGSIYNRVRIRRAHTRLKLELASKKKLP